MFESTITVSLCTTMAKRPPPSIEKEVVPFSALPRHLLPSHYHHPQSLSKRMSSSPSRNLSPSEDDGSITPVPTGTRVTRLESSIQVVETRVGTLETRVGALEKSMEAVETELKLVRRTIQNVEFLAGIFTVTYIINSLRLLRR